MMLTVIDIFSDLRMNPNHTDNSAKETSMTQKEKFEACMKLSDYSAARHDARRGGYEWKVSLGLWAALLASAAALKGMHLPFLSIFVIPVFYAAFWLRGLCIANAYDKLLSEHFRSQAEKIARDSNATIGAGPAKLEGAGIHFYFIRDWAMQFHFAVTLAISWLVWAYATG
jgi:hypothetical protein